MSYLVNNTPVIDGNRQTNLANVSILGVSGYLLVQRAFQGNVSGYTSGGYTPPVTYLNTIDKFPFASNANATDVGDLTVARAGSAGQQY